MRSKWYLLIALSFITVASMYLVQSAPISASGKLTTTEDTQAGQVRLKTDGDIIYLSSETVPGAVEEDVAETGRVATASTQSADSTLAIIGDEVGQIINLRPARYADNIGQVFRAVLNFILVIAVLLVFGYIVMGAIQWITSGGDKAKTDRARQMMTSAVIGLIIVVSSYAVINVVARFIGFGTVDEIFSLVRPISTYNLATDSAEADLTVIPDVDPE
jgi:hypothetical protein